MSDNRIAQYKADIIRRLVACGVLADRIDIAYSDEVQDYEITIGHSALSAEQVAQIVAELEGHGLLNFLAPEEQQFYLDALGAQARAYLEQRVSEMPGLPSFDPEQTDVVQFLRDIEVYCGLQPGSTLELRDNVVQLRWYPHSPEEIASANRAMLAAMLSLRASRYRGGIVGGA